MWDVGSLESAAAVIVNDQQQLLQVQLRLTPGADDHPQPPLLRPEPSEGSFSDTFRRPSLVCGQRACLERGGRSRPHPHPDVQLILQTNECQKLEQGAKVLHLQRQTLEYAETLRW